MPKKKPIPKSKPVKKTHRSFTASERAGIDIHALINTMKDEARRIELFNELEELTGCPRYAISIQSDLTIPILEEMVEILNGS